MFKHKVVCKYTCYPTTFGQKSEIDHQILDSLVKGGAERSTDHQLVLSRIRWSGRMLDRPGKHKWLVRVN